MKSQETINGKRIFFSLKWKAVFLFSLVLIAVNAGFAGLSYLQLNSQFLQHRLSDQLQQERELNALIGNGYREMQQFASLAPMLVGSDSGADDFPGRLQRVFDRHAAILDLDWDITTAVFYSIEGEALFSWGSQARPFDSRFWVNRVNESEQPANTLSCNPDCLQYTFVPIIVDAKRVGVLLLGRPLSGIVLSFVDVVGADLVLVNARLLTSETMGRSQRYLPGWGREISALSNASMILPVLRVAEETFNLWDAEQQAMRVGLENRVYEIRAIPVSDGGIKADIYLLIINDITRAIADIQDATREDLQVGFLGLMVSEGLLLLLLWTPMKRLRRLASNLPLLAELAYDDMRDRLQSELPSERFGLRDEINIVGETAIAVSHQLEALQQVIDSNTARLLERGEELARERDFVTGLLNTAQVVILTQDREGRLLMLNREGERITGYQQADMENISFSDLLSIDALTTELEYGLKAMCSGREAFYRHDCRIVSKDGVHHIISWYHSRLTESHSQTDAVVLSVGLDITEREEAEYKLTWLADHDPLTELFNRRRFMLEFEQIIKMADRYRRSAALLYFDLDHFKFVNDSSGHQAGDALLKVVADHLQQLMRSTDLLARLGGDEFAMVIPETDAEGAQQVACKIRDEIGRIELPVRGTRHHVNVSIGIAMFPDHGRTIQDLMANADLAMYQAKESGRARWHLFSLDERVREQMDAQMQWKERIDLALAEERFVLHYQPIMAISTGQISHYEVLVRMQKNDGSLIFPDEFIPTAEKSGQIHSIDRFVLRKAILRLKALGNDEPAVSFAINLSGKDMGDPELLPLLKLLLDQTGVAPSRLIFELTETAALADITASRKLMGDIRELGCKFALDDFGVGFSSFFYLKELPVDIVKIDGSFIRQLAHSPNDRIFVKALNEVAVGLGKQTVAEFIENEETLQLLAGIGIDYAQGYHIGRPGPEIPCFAAKRAEPRP